MTRLCETIADCTTAAVGKTCAPTDFDGSTYLVRLCQPTQ